MALVRGTNTGNVLSGTTLADIILGLGGNDTLSGLAGDDIMSGGAGIDTLAGGSGNDFMSGGSDQAADIVRGEAGNDMIVAMMNDRVDGGTGYDTLLINLANTFTALTLDFSQAHLATSSAIGLGTTTVASFERIELTMEVGYGSSIIGSRGNDIIGITVDGFGPGTALTIDGGGGNDFVSGSFGDDVLRGGLGDDVISSDEGSDRMTGGPGDDLFALDEDQFAFDRISDFQPGRDVLWVDHIDSDTGLPYQFLGLDETNPLVAAAIPTRNSPGGQFLYDTDNGRLVYETDTARVLVAILTNVPVITADDLLIAPL